MSALYPYAHIIHLYCAITFVGGVFFEALVLSVMHSKRVSREAAAKWSARCHTAPYA